MHVCGAADETRRQRQGTACVNFLLSPSLPFLWKRLVQDAPQTAARSCPARHAPPLQSKSVSFPARTHAHPGPGSRGVKVRGGGSACRPLPAAGPQHRPFPHAAQPGGQPPPPGVVVLPGFNARGSACFPPFLFFSFPVLPVLGVKPHSSVSIANNVGR